MSCHVLQSVKIVFGRLLDGVNQMCNYKYVLKFFEDFFLLWIQFIDGNLTKSKTECFFEQVKLDRFTLHYNVTNSNGKKLCTFSVIRRWFHQVIRNWARRFDVSKVENYEVERPKVLFARQITSFDRYSTWDFIDRDWECVTQLKLVDRSKLGQDLIKFEKTASCRPTKDRLKTKLNKSHEYLKENTWNHSRSSKCCSMMFNISFALNLYHRKMSKSNKKSAFSCDVWLVRPPHSSLVECTRHQIRLIYYSSSNEQIQYILSFPFIVRLFGLFFLLQDLLSSSMFAQRVLSNRAAQSYAIWMWNGNAFKTLAQI